MKRENLCNAVKKIAWGYIFLHLDFNLGTIDILANWIGYIWFVSAIPVIGEEEESTNLLKPLGIMLGITEGIYWVNDGFLGGYSELSLLNVIISVISLYFHFQLLTNLANVAQKYGCSQEKKLLVLRTVKTLLTTFFAVTTSFQLENLLIYILLVILLIVTVWICKVLFSFKNELEQRMKILEASQQNEVLAE